MEPTVNGSGLFKTASAMTDSLSPENEHEASSTILPQRRARSARLESLAHRLKSPLTLVFITWVIMAALLAHEVFTH